MHKLILISEEFFRSCARQDLEVVGSSLAEVRRQSVAALIGNLGKFALSRNSFPLGTNDDYVDNVQVFVQEEAGTVQKDFPRSEPSVSVT